MDLNRIEVNDLPLTSYVSYTKDISAYVKNVLNDVTYYAPNNILETSISAMLSSMSSTLVDILRALGGNIKQLDGSGSADQTIFKVCFQDFDYTLIKECKVVGGQSAPAPDTAPTRQGYRFTGWSEDFSNIQSDLTVIAQYEEIPVFTINFLDYDNNVLKSQLVQEYENATPPNDPSRTGYDFTGWRGQYENVISNADISAAYIAQTYVVNFDLHDGHIASGNAQIAVSYDSPYNKLSSISVVYDGHFFDGWYLCADFNESSKVENSTIVQIPNDHTLHAHWTEIEIQKYAVTFIDSIDSTVLDQQQVYEGCDATAPQYNSHDNYEFTGWSADFTNVHEDIIVSAMYELIELPNAFHVVRFLSKDGNELTSIEVEPGQSVSENDVPEQPIETGYTFNNWSRSWMNVTADIDICALYTANTYTVTCDSSHDNGVEELVDPMTGRNLGWSCILTVTYDQPYGNLPSCILSGDDLLFNGWRIANSTSISKISNESIVKTARNHILYPTVRHADDDFTVQFVDWNGDIINTQQVTQNSAAEEPPHPQTKIGHSFDRWSSSFSNITADTEITALYVPNVYEVSFDPNGGILKIGNNYTLSVTYGQQYGALPEATYDEHVFEGWFNNDSIVLASTRLSTAFDHTLCAHWTADMTDQEFNAMIQQLQENLNSLSNQTSSDVSDDEENVYNGEDNNMSGEVLSIENTDYDESQLSNFSLDDFLNLL